MILPLVLFLFLVLKVMLKEKLQHRSEIFLGIGLTIIGMCVFNLGLTYGLAKLGGSAGGLVPMAFMEVDGIADSPIYVYAVGLSLALLFAWVLGFGATIAEPALNALGITAEQLTKGFGMLTMASIGPVIIVMISGLWSRYRANAEFVRQLKTRLPPTWR